MSTNTTSQANSQSHQYSTNFDEDEFDRFFQAWAGDAAPSLPAGTSSSSSAQDNKVQEETSTLSDIQEDDDISMVFGIFDSLALAEKRLPSMVLGDLEAEYGDEFNHEDLKRLAQEGTNQAQADFGSSLDDVTMVDTLACQRRRSGVRRGHQDEDLADKQSAIKVPTKCHDGPSDHLIAARRAQRSARRASMPRKMNSPAA